MERAGAAGMSDDAVAVLAGDLAEQLILVPGVVGVVLGGSRARGTHLPTSDVDIGLYYEPDLDIGALRRLAATARPHRPRSPHPAAGARGWTAVAGCGSAASRWTGSTGEQGRVEQQAVRAASGEFAFHQQVGHPLGFLDVSYAGELACARLLADPSGRLAATRRWVEPYPAALRTSLAALGWEASFCLDIAAKGAARRDSRLCRHVSEPDAAAVRARDPRPGRALGGQRERAGRCGRSAARSAQRVSAARRRRTLPAGAGPDVAGRGRSCLPFAGRRRARRMTATAQGGRPTAAGRGRVPLGPAVRPAPCSSAGRTPPG